MSRENVEENLRADSVAALQDIYSDLVNISIFYPYPPPYFRFFGYREIRIFERWCPKLGLLIDERRWSDGSGHVFLLCTSGPNKVVFDDSAKKWHGVGVD